MMLRITSEVPPSMVLALDRRKAHMVSARRSSSTTCRMS
ncbi:Uncharacterised protein [Mycobacteroides abscessus subsp. abscessus]|nr:Uncharacterised protein [Mycobacteroides abscessus subsp. abscessus]